MEVITHALLPVLIARPLLSEQVNPKPRWRAFVLIAISGALPDILNPHFSLAARFASWSHSGLCWLGITMGLLLVAWLRPRWLAPRVALLMSFAYLLHHACDAISGGVVWLAPWSDEVVGGRWVPFAWWIPLDGMMIFAVYFWFRWWPKFCAWRAAVKTRRG